MREVQHTMAYHNNDMFYQFAQKYMTSRVGLSDPSARSSSLPKINEQHLHTRCSTTFKFTFSHTYVRVFFHLWFPPLPAVCCMLWSSVCCLLSSPQCLHFVVWRVLHVWIEFGTGLLAWSYIVVEWEFLPLYLHRFYSNLPAIFRWSTPEWDCDHLHVHKNRSLFLIADSPLELTILSSLLCRCVLYVHLSCSRIFCPLWCHDLAEQHAHAHAHYHTHYTHTHAYAHAHTHA